MKIPARRILVILTRRIGDVLLVTPLLRSLRAAYPDAFLAALVYRGTEGALAGNPDLDQVITLSERPGWAEYWQLVRRWTRRFDLAVCALSGDRPHYLGLLTASRRVGLVPEPAGALPWKRWLSHAWTPLDNRHLHRVEQYLRLADCLDIPRHPELVPPQDPGALPVLAARLGWDPQQTPFAVLHPTPKFHYKRWHPAGWRDLIGHLAGRGLRLVITGGPDPAELAYLKQLLAPCPLPLDNLAGCLDLAQTAELIRRARLFVGVDTAITHLAAASGVPLVALFGPTSQVKWAPWPQGHASPAPPFPNPGRVQRVGMVTLVQGPGDCVPCDEEGCDHHLTSRSRCLDQLTSDRVIEAVDAALARSAAGTASAAHPD